MSGIRPRGARAERLAEWRGWCRTQVRLRCGVSVFLAGVPLVDEAPPKGNCEGCWEWRPLDCAHLFGRGNVIGEPWASLPEMQAGLCRPCHNAVDRNRDAALRQRLRWQGLHRLAKRFPLVVGEIVELAHMSVWSDAVACARECERVLAVEVEREELPAFAPSWHRV